MKYLKEAMSLLSIENNDDILDKFSEYRRMVLEWNEKVNLTAIKDYEDFEKRHFVDSLLSVEFKGFVNSRNIIDIGTGAGFPGLPLAICFPDKQFLLVDSLNKRVNILNEIIAKLGISNASAIHGRAEDLAAKQIYRENFDLCVSRAVASLNVLSEYCLPFVRIGGYFAAYKTSDSKQELLESAKAIEILGGKYETSTDGNSIFPIEKTNHQIFWIKKISKTPAKYPRKAGMPAKNPIS